MDTTESIVWIIIMENQEIHDLQPIILYIMKGEKKTEAIDKEIRTKNMKHFFSYEGIRTPE